MGIFTDENKDITNTYSSVRLLSFFMLLTVSFMFHLTFLVLVGLCVVYTETIPGQSDTLNDLYQGQILQPAGEIHFFMPGFSINWFTQN